MMLTSLLDIRLINVYIFYGGGESYTSFVYDTNYNKTIGLQHVITKIIINLHILYSYCPVACCNRTKTSKHL